MQTYYTIPLMVVHPFQKPFCVLFISLALLFYFLQSRKEVPYNMKFVSKENSTATLTGDIFENPFKGFPNPNESSSREGFDILKFLNSSLLGDDETEKSLGTNEIKHVYILGLFELTRKNGERRKEGESELMAARIAVQHVNALNILPGYKLALLVNDTQCDPGVAIDRLFHTIYSNKTIVMLLGAGCSNVSEALAHIVPYWNIIQVSYGSKSPILSDRNKFPLFFRTVAPDSSHNIAKTHFIKHHFWQVVVAFSQSENRYLLPINHLITELERENVSCVSTVTFTLDNYKEQLIFLKNLDIRIIIGSFSLRMAPLIFCKAFELGIYGNEYLWILENHDIPWWLNQPGDCDKNALKIAIEGAIMVGDYDYSEESPTKSEEYITKYANTIANVSRYAKQSYDAIWTMALTLSSFNPDFVTNFDYGKHEVVCGFFEVMKRLKFVGLSGPIKFHGADRIGDFVVSQIQAVKSKFKQLNGHRMHPCIPLRDNFCLSQLYQRYGANSGPTMFELFIMEQFDPSTYICAQMAENRTNVSLNPWAYISCFYGPQTQELPLTLLITGVLGNIAVCIVIIKQPTLHTATNYYLFNLAVSDVTLLIFGLPNDVAMYWHQYPWPFGLYFCKFRALISETASYVSVLTVVAFSTERYIAICYPLYLRAISGLQRAIWIISALWVVSFLCASPFAALTKISYIYYPYNTTNIVEESAMCAMVGQPENLPLTELSSIIFFILPMVIIAVLYTNMGITIAKTSKNKLESKMKGSIHRKNKKNQSNRSIIRMLSLVVLGFFMCWAPFHAQRLMTIYFKDSEAIEEVNYWMFFITGLCYYFSSTLNPILYNVMSEKMRTAFREVFCGLKGKKTPRRSGTFKDTSHTYVSMHKNHSHNHRKFDGLEEDLFICKDSTSNLLRESQKNGKKCCYKSDSVQGIMSETGV
ncbi:uncharacterized protein LOC126738137 isoform X2 [Anthonomus grandis grandis]|uniref:uncharacterized protein LOC126738137 isoform X2 n=1 Tax=Anthonomus grandis grandis TaxID=2921223 RepID=UPI00216603F1|nr:uncharacterized protein LOC126738137 isoform X2 [Anthonomus grandis grandis]